MNSSADFWCAKKVTTSQIIEQNQFPATMRKVGADIDWRLTSFATEKEAKAFAAQALSRGFRVEAGTAPSAGPSRRIGWREAHDWAQSSNEGAIMSLHRRLAAFAV
ncbi:hypothetical protein [Roseiarcus sp.]|uniref:hypothetical protein n=1 Tax=Roseiarcus sp. TaxID=1969460 RepID=UPI003F9D25C9